MAGFGDLFATAISDELDGLEEEGEEGEEGEGGGGGGGGAEPVREPFLHVWLSMDIQGLLAYLSIDSELWMWERSQF